MVMKQRRSGAGAWGLAVRVWVFAVAVFAVGAFAVGVFAVGGASAALADAGAEATPRTPAVEIPVAVEALRAELGGGESLLLDARPRQAFDAGHLPGAIHCHVPVGDVPVGELPVGEVGEDLAALRRALGACGLGGEETVILYGDGPSRERLGWLFWALEWAGQRRVRVLDGSIDAWIEAGGAVVTAASQRRPRKFEGASRGDSTVTADWLLRALGTGLEVLDLRDPGGWRPGIEDEDYLAPPHFAAGHIPGALPFDFRPLLPEDGGWPDPRQVVEVVRRLGPRPSTWIDLRSTLVLSGADAGDLHPGLAYLLLRKIGADARVLPGGFSAWRRAEAPVVRLLDARELAERLAVENPDLREDRQSAGLILFDLRDRGMVARGHLPGALWLHAHDPEALAAALAPRRAGGEVEAPDLVFYCYGRDCIRSRQGTLDAARLGFSRIFWFRDGYPAWTAAGYPTFPPP